MGFRARIHQRSLTPVWNYFDNILWWPMISGDRWGLSFPDICLTGEEKPRQNPTQETCPDRRSNPGQLRDKRACYHLLHSGGPCSIKNWPRSGIKRAKNMGFPSLCSGKSALSSETFAFFETTISFSGACNIWVDGLAATSSEICTRQRCRNMNGYCDSRTMLRHALVN